MEHDPHDTEGTQQLKGLIAGFIEGNIDCCTFQALYLDRLKHCKQLAPGEFEIFGSLFGEASTLTSDPGLLNDGSCFFLDAQSLKMRARSAAIELLATANVADTHGDTSGFAAVFSQQRFVALVCADDTASMMRSKSRLALLLGPTCVEICCTGLLSTELEDEIDFDIEQRGLLHIITTAIPNAREAHSYATTAARLNGAGLRIIRPTLR
ncbi:MAG: hypothetical protein ACRES5_21130 [Pseudomonas sp.]|uniref:hypothetical protein n=1 Tax=Stenotrophomonas sp. TaxID=69392 RepID=UPI003D6D871A